MQSATGRWIEVTPPTTMRAASAAMTIGGDTSDWSEIAAASIAMQQIRPHAGHEWGEVAPSQVSLRAASDGERIYVLIDVPDDEAA